MSLQDSSYFARPDSRESARLVREGDLMSQQMGLFPELDLGHVRQVLDIACGPGGWVMDVGARYPQMQVTGIDNSSEMIEHARRLALAEMIENVVFLEMDARGPLAFEDGSFDLVNARFLHTFLQRDQWGALLKEVNRLLAPDGIVRVVEFEVGYATTPAVEECNMLYGRAMYQGQYGFSEPGRGLRISPFLLKNMQEAGFDSIGHRAHALDCSYNNQTAKAWLEEFVMLFQAALPLILKSGIVSQERMSELFMSAISEVQSPEFFAFTYFFEIWGQKIG